MPTLKPAKYAEEHVRPAIVGRCGDALAENFMIDHDDSRHLSNSCNLPLNTAENIIRRKLSNLTPWDNLTAIHFRVVCEILRESADPSEVFEYQKRLVSGYNDWFRSEDTAWSLPVLYVICRDLCNLAIRADQALLAAGSKASKLSEAARLIQVGFGLCCSDRTAAEETKKTGVLFTANSLFKIYFKLKSVALCKNVIRGVDNAGMLIVDRIPMAHRVTYRYYMGVLCFLQQEYDKAEEHLDFAFKHCHRSNHRNRELILDLLIPMRLSQGKRPIPALLKKFARLAELYQPFIRAIRLGDIESFDKHMTNVEKRLMDKRTYLVVERCRDVCLCNLVKMIHRIKGNTHQIPLQAFKALAYDDDCEPEDYNESGPLTDHSLDEVECVLANLIAQDRVRGYIHHQAKMLVLSKVEAFPPQTSITNW